MTIPTPERGQPIDTSLISQIVQSVNSLTQSISPALYKYVTVDTKNNGKQSRKTSETGIVGGYIEVTNAEFRTAGTDKDFTYSLGGNFKFAPIVTATPLNISGTPAGSNVSVILTSVTTTDVKGVVRFNTTGEVSVAIQLIAIGIPN